MKNKKTLIQIVGKCGESYSWTLTSTDRESILKGINTHNADEWQVTVDYNNGFRHSLVCDSTNDVRDVVNSWTDKDWEEEK